MRLKETGGYPRIQRHIQRRASPSLFDIYFFFFYYSFIIFW